MIDNEEWRAIVGYEGYYEVSSLGRIKSLARTTRHGHKLKEKIVNQSLNNSGYLGIGLFKNSRQEKFLTHRLVAQAFIGPRPDGKQINHKNGAKGDNSAVNLEYVTPSENQMHSYASGLQTPIVGVNHYKNKLSEGSVLLAIQMSKEGFTDRQIGEKFGVCRQAIYDIRTGRNWCKLTGIIRTRK